jgi:hypothetical protein
MEEQKTAVQPLTSFAIVVQGICQWFPKARKTAPIYICLAGPSFIFTVFQKLFLPNNKGFEFVVGLISFALSSWAAIALIHAVCEKQNEKTPQEYIVNSLPFLWPYIGAVVLWFLALALIGLPGLLGLAFLINPQSLAAGIGIALFEIVWLVAWVSASVYTAIRFALFGFACALEQLGPIASLKRSWEWCNPKSALVAKTMLIYMGFAMLANLPVFTVGLLVGQSKISAVVISLLSFALSACLIPAQTHILSVLLDNVKEAS